MDVLLDGIQGQMTTVLVLSGVLALLIVGGVWFAWIRGRRLVNRSRASVASWRYTSLFSGADEPGPPRSGRTAPVQEEGEEAPRTSGVGPDSADPTGAEEVGTGNTEPIGTKLVREAAMRTAAFREAWDRSYREARGSAAPGDAPPGHDLDAVLDEVLREQRETNALLRELVERMDRARR